MSYDEKEIMGLEYLIMKQFGAFEVVNVEQTSEEMEVKIAVIPPQQENEYYTLVTMGLGAYEMNVPDELKSHQLEFAELVAYVPANWDLESGEEKYRWVFHWLRHMARFPITKKSWIGFGRSMKQEKAFHTETELNSILFLNASVAENLRLPSGKKINFYVMMPLYAEEIQYKIETNAQKLLEKFDAFGMVWPPVIENERRNVCVEEKEVEDQEKENEKEND